jgi:hypothetical protein
MRSGAAARSVGMATYPPVVKIAAGRSRARIAVA